MKTRKTMSDEIGYQVCVICFTKLCPPSLNYPFEVNMKTRKTRSDEIGYRGVRVNLLHQTLSNFTELPNHQDLCQARLFVLGSTHFTPLTSLHSLHSTHFTPLTSLLSITPAFHPLPVDTLQNKIRFRHRRESGVPFN